MAEALRFLNDRYGFQNLLKPSDYARKGHEPAQSPKHPLYLLYPLLPERPVSYHERIL
jgi:hypothetical protein